MLDINYNNSLQYHFVQEGVKNDCKTKDIISLKIRTIFIRSTNSNHEIPSNSYDSIYTNIIQAIQNEIRILVKFLNSILNIYLEDGIHIIEQNQFERVNQEFFRRMLIKIYIKPITAFKSTFILRTNKFFFFISDFLYIQNINFIGNDINTFLSSDSGQYFVNDTIFCQETDYLNNTFFLNEDKKMCNIRNKIISDSFDFSLYGLFNLEYITDNSDKLLVPTLIIENCFFKNFNLINIDNGFSILISFAPVSGNLMLNSVKFDNFYFPNGLIYYSLVKFDFLYNNLNVDLLNYFKLNESIQIINCSFLNYNLYNIQNINNYFFQLHYFKGLIKINGSIFENFYNIISLYYVENLISNEFEFNNCILNNISETSILIIKFCKKITIDNLTINVYTSNKPTPIVIESVDSLDIIHLIGKYFRMSVFLKISNTKLFVNDSIIMNGKLNNFIIQNNGNLFLYNISLISISFSDYFFYYISSKVLYIENSIFSNLKGNLYLFMFLDSDEMIFNNSIIENVLISSLFYTDRCLSHKNYFSIIRNNTFNYIWEKDKTCKNIINEKTEIYGNNVGISLYRDVSVQNIVFNLTIVFIYDNNYFLYNTGGMIQMQYGVCIYDRSVFVNNFFINADKFQNVHNFFGFPKLYVKNCFFKDNGVIIKKKIYFSYSDNNEFFLFNVPYSLFENITMVASDKIELLAGFISSAPHGGIFELFNSKFIFFKIKNTDLEYKGIQLDNFKSGKFINNSFYEMKCNNKTFTNQHGGISLIASTKYTFSKGQNKYTVLMQNNSFYNCSCINGGGLSIIGIMSVVLIDIYFYNSKCERFGGSLILVGSENCMINNIVIIDSQANEGGAIYIMNILNGTIFNLKMENILSRKNGAIYVKNIDSFFIKNMTNFNTTALMKGGVFYISNSYLIIENINSENSYSSIEGGVFICDLKVNLLINYLFINNASSNQGAVFSILNVKLISIKNSFINNTFTVKNGGIGIFLIFNEITFSDVIIFNSKCSEGRGAITIQNNEEIGIFTINSLKCIQNYAIEGACIYFLAESILYLYNIVVNDNFENPFFIMGQIKINIFFENITIENSISSNNIILISTSNLLIKNLNYFNNSAISEILFITDSDLIIFLIEFLNNGDNNMFKISFSKCKIKDLRIFNEFKKIGFFEIFHSDCFMNNASFSKAEKIDQISEIKYSFFHIDSSGFFNNIGLSLYFIESNVSIISCNFTNNTSNNPIKSNDIYVENSLQILSFIYINYTNFNNYNGFSTKFYGRLKLILYSNNFFNFNLYNKNFAILINNIFEINILSNSFINLTDKSIQINCENMVPIYVIIQDSNFINNKADKGSSICLIGNINIIIINSIFKNNSAIKKSNKILEGASACIFFQSSFKITSFIEIINSKFINNYAEFVAPTLLSQIKPIIDKKTFFENNYDKINFTNTYLSFPIKLLLSKIISENNSISFNEFNSTSIDLIFNSGTPFTLVFGIFDSNTQLINFDDKTFLTIKSKMTNTIENKSISIENNMNYSNKGYITFDSFRIKLLSNNNISLLISGEFSAFSDYTNSLTQNLELILNLKSRNCTFGEIIKDDFSCIKCPFSTYSFIDPMKTELKYHKCNDCPPNAFCEGNYILPNYGYFRFLNTSKNVIKCISPDSCLGFSQQEKLCEEENCLEKIPFQGMCSIGNFGPLCSYCNYLYGRYEKEEKCKMCANLNTLIIVRLIGSVLLMTFYILLNNHFAEKYNKKKNDSDLGVFTKIILNHCQQINIILASGINFSLGFLSDLFKSFEFVSFTNDNVITNECFFQNFYYEKNFVNVIKIILNLFLPILLSLLAFIIWTIFIIYKNFKIQINFSCDSLSIKLKLFIVLSVYVFYPLIIKSCLSLFDCMSLDSDLSESYLILALELACWDKTHLRYLLTIGLPGLLIWGIGFPLFLFYSLKKNFIVTKSQKVTINPLNNDKLTINELKVEKSEITQAYSFFYKGYNSDYYYWESLIFLRKLVITLFATLNGTLNSELKWIIIIIILFIYLYFTMICLPYDCINKNIMEMLSICACIIFVFCLINLEVETENNFQVFAFLLLIISQLIFFIFCFINMIKAFKKSMITIISNRSLQMSISKIRIKSKNQLEKTIKK